MVPEDVASAPSSDAAGPVQEEDGSAATGDDASPDKDGAADSPASGFVPDDTPITIPDDINDYVIPFRRYNVYEYGISGTRPDAFSATMCNNPIDKRMYAKESEQAPSATQDVQVFYVDYIRIWKDELSFSIGNLKLYLSEEEAVALDAAQGRWEEGITAGLEFDRMLLDNRCLIQDIGTQRYLRSYYAYVKNQYRERVFHIKYMTYLVETGGGDLKSPPVEGPDQLWNRFHSLD
jgi:hypothetical protein